MGKSPHYLGLPPFSQVIKLLDKPKIIKISREHGGEHYTRHPRTGKKKAGIKVHTVIHAVVWSCSSTLGAVLQYFPVGTPVPPRGYWEVDKVCWKWLTVNNSIPIRVYCLFFCSCTGLQFSIVIPVQVYVLQA